MEYSCPKCGGEVSHDVKDISSDEYFCACVGCDEDFYKFEVEED